ncbi:MAG: DNA replication and repair protein RecF [Acidobacteria bacterium]|nr:DNA replication and repair protein RecF [Acidobacteriota bacterium]
MHLQSLAITDFRNIASGQCSLHSRLNFFYGSNAAGKTNWLEAIYFLGTTRSFRTAHPAEAIAYDHTQAVVRGTLARGESRRELAVNLGVRSRTAYVNAKREPNRDYLANMPVFACTMADLSVIRGGPEFRRKYLDEGLLSVDPGYGDTLVDYDRTLRQKNRLLRKASRKGIGAIDMKELEVWEDRLIDLARGVHLKRNLYVGELQRHFQQGLFDQEVIDFQYVSSVTADSRSDMYPARFRERIRARREAEFALGYAVVGPHRDELNLKLGGRDLKRFGSSGQERSALLVLDLARLAVYNARFDEKPLFLVDDVDAELDGRRIETLVAQAHGHGQLFFSTSKFDLPLAYSSDAALFLIENGSPTLHSL